MYKIAEAYEELANSIAGQTLSPNLTAERRLVERDRVFKASVPAYDKAVEEYKNVITNIPVYAEKLDISLFDTTAVEAESETTLEDSTEIIRKIEFEDSTREIALKWYNQSQMKVSSILYTVAERSSEFIDAYLFRDEEGDYVLRSSPCPFLGADNKCLVYEDRPKACREYPHTNRKNMLGILDLSLKNTLVCPAVLKIFYEIGKDYRK